MSSPTLAIKLDSSKSAQLKDGFFPIVLQVTYQRVPKRIRLGLKAKPNQWDGSRVHTSINNGAKINRKLDAFEDFALEIYEDNFEGKRFDFKSFSRLFKKGSQSHDFYSIAEEFIKLKKRSNTRKYYRECILSLQKLKPSLDISQVTSKVLVEHCSTYNSSAYLRGIKAVVNFAIMSKYMDASNNPFKTAYNPTGFSFTHIKQKHKPIAFTEDEMEEYKKIVKPTLYHDLGMFSYYTFGINMWDFLQFTDDNLVDGAIHFTRSKTGVEVVVPLVPQASGIIERRRKGKRWFPLCDFKNEEKAKKRVDNLRKKVSNRIKKNATKLGITKRVSFYTMRHSAASISLKRGAPIEKISALLGHSDISITQTYLDGFLSKELKSTVDLL